MTATQIPPFVQAICDGHVLAMKCGAQALRWLDRSNGNPHDSANLRILNEAASMAHLSARLMQHQQSAHKLWLRAGHLPGMVEFGLPTAARTPEGAAPAKLHAAAGAARGRLNNGNPSGDYLKSPRCGARTRAGGSCRQPAIRNGRCRMHGGLSTGPRTAEGLARCRRTRFVHGFRSHPVLQFRRRAVHTARQLRELSAALRLAFRNSIPAGHGVHRPNSIFAGTAMRNLAPVAPGAADMSFRSHLRSSAAKPNLPAGHGLHRSNLVPGLKPRSLVVAC